MQIKYSRTRTCCGGSMPALACASARDMAVPRIEPRLWLLMSLLKLLPRPGS